MIRARSFFEEEFMIVAIRTLAVAACAASLAFIAAPASAHAHRHHLRHPHHQTVAAARHRDHSPRLAKVRRKEHVATARAEGPRHAALCEKVMVHRQWVTRCRGET